MRPLIVSLLFPCLLVGCAPWTGETSENSGAPGVSPPVTPVEVVAPRVRPVEGLSAEEAKRALRRVNLDLALVRATFKGRMEAEPPMGRMAATLVRAGATEVSYLVSPRGEAFGFAVKGDGRAFERALCDLVRALLNLAAARKVAILGHAVGWKALRFEACFVRPAWLRAGVEGLPPSRLRAILQAMKVDTVAVKELLALPDALPGGLSVDVIGHPARGEALVISRRVGAADGAAHDKAALGEGTVIKDFVLGWQGSTWYRRPGLAGEFLEAWQRARGFDPEAMARVAGLQRLMKRKGPSQIVWQSGRLRETLVYVYRRKLKDVLR